MIVISLLLILVAITLLVLGLMSASSLLLIGSIVGSLLAAVTLVVGMRQTAAARAEMIDNADVMAEADTKSDEYGAPAEEYLDEEFAGYEGRRQRREGTSSPVTSTEFRDEAYPGFGASEPEQPVYREPVPPQREPADDPEDEPEPQDVTAAEAARVARMTSDVYVVDGRPRYHLAGCVHLMDKEAEPLPVNEAADLGFTPCGLCEPDSALLADARRV
ncbi:hypothetical protein J2S43_000490 [Catenuloplanes nepalensis]|uniref:Uncharacterized protein n=1 Tax=Catenuloplanes nepalensis TaxID=587533 RepID=A0ABT9MKM5_9ACTN|nr:hypothetical protein [Catenuloplanes nepalensis]MDP9791978.1 hypothetical protein [Catenuloplanes nepalensis]